MSKTDLLIVGVLSLSLLGCASVYKPSPEVSALKHRLTKSEAIATLNELLVPRHVEFKDSEGKPYKELYGFCAASPYKWDHVDIHDPYASASEIGMKVRVFRRGKFLGTYVENGLTIQRWEKIHEDMFLPFGNIKSAKIHRPGVLSSNCMPKNGETEVMVREKDSLLKWYVIMVPEKDRARLIAALMQLAPEVEFLE